MMKNFDEIQLFEVNINKTLHIVLLLSLVSENIQEASA